MQFRFAISRNMPCRFATRGWRKTEKSQESAKVPAVGHKCPNYLAVGIRSTAIIWTATPKSRWPSKFAGRTRANERSRHPLLAPLVVRIRIPTHQTTSSPAPPLKTSSSSSLSPFAGQTNSVHLAFPERTVDSSTENFPQSIFEKIFDCARTHL